MKIYSLNEEDFSLLGVNAIVPSTEKSKFLVGMDEEGNVVSVLQYYGADQKTGAALTFASVQTENKFKGKGYMTQMLNHFFVTIVKKGEHKKIRVTAYSQEGELFVKPVINQLCNQFDVQIVEEDNLSNAELISLYLRKGC